MLTLIRGYGVALCLATTLVPLVAVAQEPTPDRSGEAALKKLLTRYGELKGIDVEIRQSTREAANEPMYTDRAIRVRFDEGVRFRVDMTEMWGETLLVISDGTTVARDSLYEGAPVRLSDAQDTMIGCEAELAPGKGSGSILFLLLEGPNAWDKLVSEKGSVTDKPFGRKLRVIQFTSKLVGGVSLFYDPTDRLGLVTRIEYDDKQNKVNQARSMPQWFDMPQDPLVRQDLTYFAVATKLPHGLFVTAQDKGRAVQDERKKKHQNLGALRPDHR